MDKFSGFKDDKIVDWLLFGLFGALGILSKYLFVYLLAAMDIFLCYMIIKKKVSFKSFISLIPFFLILFPHLIWLTENDYITITYGLHRTGTGNQNFLDHHTNDDVLAKLEEMQKDIDEIKRKIQ